MNSIEIFAMHVGIETHKALQGLQDTENSGLRSEEILNSKQTLAYRGMLGGHNRCYVELEVAPA